MFRVTLNAVMFVLLLSAFFYAQVPSSADVSVYHVGAGVSAPKMMYFPTCEMPELARKLRAQGNVTLSLVVTAEGAIRDVRVVKSAGYGMDELAVDCLRKSRFKPGEKDGTPVDVEFLTGRDFGMRPQPRLWGAGPVVFPTVEGVTTPILKSGAVPTSEREPGDEVVLFEFTVDPKGQVRDIRALEGRESASLSVLAKSLSSWKFTPASSASGPVAATGKVVFIKGEDYFRYRVYTSFRNSGSVHPPEPKPAVAPAAPRSVVTVTVPLRVNLEPEEATRYLVDRVAPVYPEAAKVARIQGTVSLSITIDTDGSVKSIEEISGPRELIAAATEAVRQWRYKPVVFQGQAREATTVVDLVFELPN
jgi:TonB family protein